MHILQYVGKTFQELNKRFKGHRTGFKQPSKYGFYKILSDYFLLVVCCKASYSVQILETLSKMRRTVRNALLASITCRRTQQEKTWMLKLRTIFLYGLNDCLGDMYKKQDAHVLVLINFFLILEHSK